MNERIENIVIFKDPNPYDELSYGWLLAAPHKQEPLRYTADRRVPTGMPYLIVTQSLLPVNFWNEMSAYTIDFSNPDGFGSGSHRYTYDGVEYRIEPIFTGSYVEWKEVNNV